MGLGVIGSAVARVLLEKGEVFSKQLGAYSNATWLRPTPSPSTAQS
jgi:homoserine dehydrogenase